MIFSSSKKPKLFQGGQIWEEGLKGMRYNVGYNLIYVVVEGDGLKLVEVERVSILRNYGNECSVEHYKYLIDGYRVVHHA